MSSGIPRIQRWPATIRQCTVRDMPVVEIKVTKGVTREQKKALVAGVTKLLVDVLDKKPEHTHVLLTEIDDDDWGFDGMLTTDWKKKQQR
jgi:4-oxalocrotonate tautomerase